MVKQVSADQSLTFQCATLYTRGCVKRDWEPPLYAYRE